MTVRLRAEASVAAIIARIAVRALPLPLAVRAVRRLTPGPLARASEADCHRAAADASRRLAHPTCLYRAIVEYALLARRFDDVRFHVGAATHASFAAHAWTTTGGRAADQEASAYLPLWTES